MRVIWRRNTGSSKFHGLDDMYSYIKMLRPFGSTLSLSEFRIKSASQSQDLYSGKWGRIARLAFVAYVASEICFC